MASSQSSKLHILLFPLLAQGHMIPMIDIAKLLAERGVIVTIISTPLNTLRFKPIITRANETAGLDIRLVELQIAYDNEEDGLPEGCENFDMLPSISFAGSFFSATNNLQPQLEKYMEDVEPPKPSCIISDQFVTCTIEVARKFGIPRFVFHATCCFSLLCWHRIIASKVLDSVTSDSEPFVVPGLSGEIEFTQAEVSMSFDEAYKGRDAFLASMLESEEEAYGIVLNSFEDMELQYVEEYKKLKAKKKVYFVGPVSLCHKDQLDKAERGNKTSVDENQCLMKWLDSWESSSVVYACLGSLSELIPSQMMELGWGLESSKKPFIWVIRENNDSKELKKLILEDGLEERIQGRGLLIWGWAPQVLILSHLSIGAFLTHCGWNSILEGLCVGLPFITWPLFADHCYIDKLVDLLGVGVKICTEREEEKMGFLMKKANVEKAIISAMDGGEDCEERKKKAKELGERANKAMEEGGSSYLNMTMLIEDIMQHARNKEST